MSTPKDWTTVAAREELRRLHEAATPEPWHAHPDGEVFDAPAWAVVCAMNARYAADPNHEPEPGDADGSEPLGLMERDEDRAIAVAARNALPHLLDALDKALRGDALWERVERQDALLRRCVSGLLAVSTPWGATDPDQRAAARLLYDLHVAGYDPMGGWDAATLADLRGAGFTPEGE